MNNIIKFLLIMTILATLRVSGIYPTQTKMPPKIPHSIENKDCLSCHKEGKEVNGKKAPVTKHPERKACASCHKPSK